MSEYNYSFYLNGVEEERARAWMDEQELIIAKEQSLIPEMVKHHPEIVKGIPYLGAIGGLFDFIFTRTSIGDGIHIRNTINGELIDVTDYDCW